MKRNFLGFLLIFLAFSYLISASAIPATRTQNLNGEATPAFSSLPKLEDALKLENGEKLVQLADMDKLRLIERRIDLETQDYEGAGANKDHNPKSPGRA